MAEKKFKKPTNMSDLCWRYLGINTNTLAYIHLQNAVAVEQNYRTLTNGGTMSDLVRRFINSYTGKPKGKSDSAMHSIKYITKTSYTKYPGAWRELGLKVSENNTPRPKDFILTLADYFDSQKISVHSTVKI